MTNEIRGTLPVKVDSTSNGEFRPVPLTEHVARANKEAERRIGEHAKMLSILRYADELPPNGRTVPLGQFATFEYRLRLRARHRKQMLDRWAAFESDGQYFCIRAITAF